MKDLLMNSKPAALQEHIRNALNDWLDSWLARQASTELFQRRIDPLTGAGVPQDLRHDD